MAPFGSLDEALASPPPSAPTNLSNAGTTPSAAGVVKSERLFVDSFEGMGDTSLFETLPTSPEHSETSRVLEIAGRHAPPGAASSDRLTFLPPLGVAEQEFVASASGIKSSFSRYVQVLIWCLTRRAEQAGFGDRRKAALVREFLSALKRRLAEGRIRPRLYTQPSAPLKPRLPNPENERMHEVLADLSGFKLKLDTEREAERDRLEAERQQQHDREAAARLGELPAPDADFEANSADMQHFYDYMNTTERMVCEAAKLVDEREKLLARLARP